MNKILKKCKYNTKIIFSKIPKDEQTTKRHDKISIFEYFNIVEERKYAKVEEILIREIVDYMNSENFEKEFKHSISTETKKFKFLLINLTLLRDKIEKEKPKNFEYFIKQKKILFRFKYLPIKLYSFEVIKYFISQNQIYSLYNHIVESEMLKKLNRLDIKYLNYRKDLDLENEEEFKYNKIKKFLFEDEDANEMIDKIYTYILAHVNTFNLEKLS